MSKARIHNSISLVALSLVLLAISPLQASEPESPDRLGRLELWLGASSWPALSDLGLPGTGSFDDTGVGLGGSLHTQAREFEDSELLWGIDAFIFGTESNIRGILDTYVARHLYFGGSVRWRLGKHRNVLLDAGIGYHLVDITDVDDNYGSYAEIENWEASRAGAFVGATWDIGISSAEETRGFFVSIKTHFVEFGTVHDEGTAIVPVLGPNAGTLDGPIYMLQIGYGGI